MVALDPRVNAFRPDLAAEHLRGQVEATRFVEGTNYEVTAQQTAVRHEPRHDAALDSEALMGERVTIYDTTEEGWAWGQLEADGYVGWLSTGALRRPGRAPTHKVSALRSLVFPGPSFKLPPTDTIPLGGRIPVDRIEGSYAITANGGYVPAIHLAPVNQAEKDFVEVAERFVGTPYLWGGKTNAGIDCSGLLQIALNACGISCPRESDLQEKQAGRPIPLDPENLARGDLLFWKGHVAIATDRNRLIHANAFHMSVVYESTRGAIARIRAAGDEPTSARRVSVA